MTTINCLTPADIDNALELSWMDISVIAIYNGKEYRLCEDLEGITHFNLMRDSNTLAFYGFDPNSVKPYWKN